MINELLEAGKKYSIDLNRDFSSISAKKLFKVWRYMNSHNRSTFRSYYLALALEEMHGAKYEIAQEMERWKARNAVVHLEDVLMWNPMFGALTSIEWETVRRYLESNICLLYTSPSPRDRTRSRMPSSA